MEMEKRRESHHLQWRRHQESCQENGQRPRQRRYQTVSNTDLSPRKGSVGVHQDTCKPDGRTRKDRALCSQCVTAAKENAGVKMELEVGGRDLAKVNKQSVESERLLGEK